MDDAGESGWRTIFDGSFEAVASWDKHAAVGSAVISDRLRSQPAAQPKAARIAVLQAARRVVTSYRWQVLAFAATLLLLSWQWLSTRPVVVAGVYGLAFTCALWSGASWCSQEERGQRVVVVEPCTAAEANAALLYASGSGDADSVAALLRHGRADPRFCDSAGIRCAAVHGHTAVVQLLLRDGRANPAADRDGALLAASKNGHLAVVNALLADRRVFASSESFGTSALNAAADGRNWPVVLRLLDHPRSEPSMGRYVFLVPVAAWADEAVLRACLAHRSVTHHRDMFTQHNDFGVALGVAVKTCAVVGRQSLVDSLLTEAATRLAEEETRRQVFATIAQLDGVAKAAARDRLAIVQRLLCDRSVFSREEADWLAGSALVAAAKANACATFAWLLRPQACATTRDTSGSRPSDTSGSRPSDASGSRPSAPPAGDSVSLPDAAYRGRALVAAASQGHARIVRLLLESEAVTAASATAGAAATTEAPDPVDSDAEANAGSESQGPQAGDPVGAKHFAAALVGAAGSGCVDAVALLLSAPRGIDRKACTDALQQACRSGHAAVLDRLLDDPRVDAAADSNAALAIAAAAPHSNGVKKPSGRLPFQVLMERHQVQATLGSVDSSTLWQGLDAVRLAGGHLSAHALRALARRQQELFLAVVSDAGAAGTVDSASTGSSGELDDYRSSEGPHEPDDDASVEADDLTASLREFTLHCMPGLLAAAWARRRAAVLGRVRAFED